MKRQAIVLLTMTGLMLVAASLSATGAFAASPQATSKAVTASASSPVRVSDISIKDGKTGETFVDVATSSAPTFQVLQLEHPRRLVVDLQGARIATPRKLFAATSALLKGVRLGQFRESNPAVVRVVADLDGDPAFDVHRVPGGVRIELRSRELAQGVKTSPPAPVSEPLAQQNAAPVSLAVAQNTSLPLASLPLRSDLAPPVPQPAALAVTPSESPRAIATTTVHYVDFQNALPDVPGSQAAAAPVSQRVTPNQTPEALQAVKAAQTLAAAIPSGLMDAQGSAPAGAAPAAEQPRYTGEPISLNLKDVDVKDFFRLIHEISGLNIIVDPNVSGSVTIVLDQVPWDQALDIVLKNNGLGKVLEGSVLRIAKMDTLTAEQDTVQKLAAAREESAPLVTVYRTVNYAKPDVIAGMIKSWVGGGALTKRGNILVDARTSTLIISDIQSQIPILQDIVTKLDKKAKQVLIEARVVLASTTFSRSLQAALTGSFINNSTLAGGASAGSGVTATATQNGTTTPGGTVSTSFPTVSGFGAAAITNLGARYFIDAAIAAAETRNEAKTISRPSIITQNNSTGTVVQGTQIPITTTIGTTISTQMTTAALTLSVTPQVTEDGNVFMIINVTNNSPGGTVETPSGASVTINTQSATTQVMVPDGGTVVFGGVTVTTRGRTENGVPLLGSIPILGHLFKSTSVTDSDSELLFFISPKILPS